LFTLSAHDDIEIVEKREWIARGQGTASDEQPALSAQAPGKPNAIFHQSHHAVDAYHLRPRRHCTIQGVIPFHEGAVQQAY
jgi:hypothetical protein